MALRYFVLLPLLLCARVHEANRSLHVPLLHKSRRKGMAKPRERDRYNPSRTQPWQMRRARRQTGDSSCGAPSTSGPRTWRTTSASSCSWETWRRTTFLAWWAARRSKTTYWVFTSRSRRRCWPRSRSTENHAWRWGTGGLFSGDSWTWPQYPTRSTSPSPCRSFLPAKWPSSALDSPRGHSPVNTRPPTWHSGWRRYEAVPFPFVVPVFRFVYCIFYFCFVFFIFVLLLGDDFSPTLNFRNIERIKVSQEWFFINLKTIYNGFKTAYIARSDRFRR